MAFFYSRTYRAVSLVFHLVVGASFLLVGLTEPRRSTFNIVFGLCALLVGPMLFRRSWRGPQPPKDTSDRRA